MANSRSRLILGDTFDELPQLDADSIDAIVTDPPYGLEFMGKEWDRLGATVVDPAGVGGFQDGNGGNAYSRSRIRFGSSARTMQDWHHAWSVQALRVLKPGGHLLAFGGTRTYHRLACALEDAGFEIRDCLAWIYGSGFPKSLNIGNGHGTALKPAHEPIVLARKPLRGTVAANVLEHGVGALNVDACRVDSAARPLREHTGRTGATYGAGLEGSRAIGETDLGRWPANVILDPEAAELLDEQSGELTSGRLLAHHHKDGRVLIGTFGIRDRTGEECDFGGDTGGASRFFYCAKTSTAERNAGCGGLASRAVQEYGTIRTNRGAGYDEASVARNSHPTVKPIALMRWLIRLITPPGGHVLDPFTGSGTTGIAAALEGARFTGIERDADYHKIAQARIEWWAEHGEHALAAEQAEAERAELADTGQRSIFDALEAGS